MASSTIKRLHRVILPKQYISSTSAESTETQKVPLQSYAESEIIVHKNKENRKIHEDFIQIGTLGIDKTSKIHKYLLRTAANPKTKSEKQKSTIQEDPILRPFSVVKDHIDQQGVNGFPLRTRKSYLEPGNIIKLGRIEFTVIELKNEHETISLRDTNHF